MITLLFMRSEGLAQSVAKYAGEFLSIGVGGRALGLGGAVVAQSTDATAGYWNPAGMTETRIAQVGAMHDERYAGLVNYDFAGAVVPYGDDARVGFSIIRLGMDGIPDTRKALLDQNGNGQLDPGDRIDYSKVTTFGSADWAFMASYAQRWTSDLSLGLTVKLIRRTLAEFSATGIGVDIGALYRVGESIMVGANAQDITTTFVAWSTGRNELISPTLKVGGAGSFDILGAKVTPAVGADFRADNRRFASATRIGPLSVDPTAGLEIVLQGTVALRAGYSDLRQPTLGAGIRLSRLDIDYAFTGFASSGELGVTHRLSLGLRLEAGESEPGESP